MIDMKNFDHHGHEAKAVFGWTTAFGRYVNVIPLDRACVYETFNLL